MKTSADRILYLARVLAQKLKGNLNLVQKGDDETVRRAIVPPSGKSAGIHFRASSTCTGSICNRKFDARTPRPGKPTSPTAITRFRPAT